MWFRCLCPMRGRVGTRDGGDIADFVERQRTLAEGEGFEPSVSFPTHAFQACRFGRSRTPPGNPACVTWSAWSAPQMTHAWSSSG